MCAGLKRPVRRGDTLQFTAQVFSASPAQGLYRPYTAGIIPPYCGTPPARTAPQNITGWTGYCTLKRHEQDADAAAVYQATSLVGGGMVYPSPASGVLQVTVPPSATYQMADGELSVYYDIQLIDPSGNVWTVEDGVFEVEADITRAIAGPPPTPTPSFAFQGTAIYLVASSSVLGAANAAGLPSGTMAWVPTPSGGSGGYFWILDHQSTQAPGATVIAAVPAGTGNWVRSTVSLT